MHSQPPCPFLPRHTRRFWPSSARIPLTRRSCQWVLKGWLVVWLWHAVSVMALDLNTATEAELDSLSGFGPTFTARVMQARAEHPFKSWADFIRRVRGVREATALKLSRQGARIQEEPYGPASAPARASRD